VRAAGGVVGESSLVPGGWSRVAPAVAVETIVSASVSASSAEPAAAGGADGIAGAVSADDDAAVPMGVEGATSDIADCAAAIALCAAVAADCAAFAELPD
jgi:hypothetical protein